MADLPWWIYLAPDNAILYNATHYITVSYTHQKNFKKTIFAVDAWCEMSEDVAACQPMDSKDNNVGRLVDGPLSGTFEHALDPKRRITIPSVWREVMGSPAYLYVMADPHDACLTIVPPEALQQRLARLRQQPLFDDGMTEALRDLFEDAEYLAVDVQGRIRISDVLLSYAQLEEQAVLRGIGVRIQLWSPARRPRRTTIDPAVIANAARVLNF